MAGRDDLATKQQSRLTIKVIEKVAGRRAARRPRIADELPESAGHPGSGVPAI
jgi:hypothetical protein